MRGAFMAAAKALAQPIPRPQLRKRRRTQGEQGDGLAYADRYAARKLTSDHLKLCHNPTKDLRRWLAEDKKRPYGGGPITPRRETTPHDPRTHRAALADADRIRRQPLPHLRGGLDAHRQGRMFDRVPARPRASSSGYDELRPLRVEGASGRLIRRGDGATVAAGNGEQAALAAFFRAKGEALRRSLPRHEIAAALRALEHERAAMMKAITDRRHGAQAAAQEKRQSEREARRGGASPPPAYG